MKLIEIDNGLAVKLTSKSGRIVIDPKDWNIAYGMKVNPNGGKRLLSQDFKFSWNVIPMFKNSFAPKPSVKTGAENAITIAQGLPIRKHKLILKGGVSAILKIRVYKPLPVN